MLKNLRVRATIDLRLVPILDRQTILLSRNPKILPTMTYMSERNGHKITYMTEKI